MEMGMQSVLIVELEYIVARLGFKFSKSSIKDQRYVLNQKQNETRMQTWRKMEHFLAFSTGQNQAWCLRQYPAYCWYRVLNYLKKVHLILWPLCSSTAPAIWKYFMKAHIQETHKMAPISKYKHLWDFSNFEVAEMKKIWAKWKNVVVKRTKKSRNPPLVVSENHHAHIPVRYYLYPLWFYSTGRNNFLLLFCCSHTESSALDSDEALSDDLADAMMGKVCLRRKTKKRINKKFSNQPLKTPHWTPKPYCQWTRMLTWWKQQHLSVLSPMNRFRTSQNLRKIIMWVFTTVNSDFHTNRDLNVKNHDTIDMAPRAISLPSVTEIQQASPESEEIIETSGRGRRKRAPRQIEDLNSCLCGMAVNLGVDSNRAIKCRQHGCETQWVCSTLIN